MRAPLFIAGFIALAAPACGSSSVSRPTTDSGPADSGVFDSGPEGTRRDAGPSTGMNGDGGFADPATVVQGTVEIGRVDTYVHVMGTTTSTLPTVVFVHMGPGFGHEYLPAEHRFLLANRLLVYFDLRAQGRTSIGPSSSSTVTADQHAGDLGDVIDFAIPLGASSTVDLIGHGYGAGVAALHTARDPRHIGRLVLVNPFPLHPVELADMNAEALSRLTQGERSITNQLKDEPFCRGNVRLCTIQLWNLAGPHYLCDSNRDRFFDLTFVYGDYRQKTSVEYYLLRDQYDWRREIPAIAVPTTIISGPCDPTPTEVAATYASLIRGSVHQVIDGAGFFPMVERRETYQRIVRRALHR